MAVSGKIVICPFSPLILVRDKKLLIPSICIHIPMTCEYSFPLSPLKKRPELHIKTNLPPVHTFSITVTKSGNTSRQEVLMGISFQELCDSLQLGQNEHLYWKDRDGDYISLKDEEDWEVCLEEFGEDSIVIR